MKNFEKYESRIKKLMKESGGIAVIAEVKLEKCEHIDSCKGCIFSGMDEDCNKLLLEWLYGDA